MPEEKPKRTIKEVVQEARRQQKLPALVENLRKDIEKARMSKEEIREKFNKIPKEKIEEYKEIAKSINLESTAENIVALYMQERERKEITEKPKKEFIKRAKEIFSKGNLSASEEQLEAVAFFIQRFEKAPEEAGMIASQLGYIASNTKSEKAVSDAALCISKYEKFPEAAGKIAYQLGRIASNTKSEKAVSDTTNCISKYEKSPEAAGEIADQLGEIAHYTKSEKAVSDAALYISKYEKSPGAAGEIAYRLKMIASKTKSEKAVSDAAKCLSLDVVFNCISKYKKSPEAAKEIVYQLGEIAEYTKNEKAVSDAAKLIEWSKDVNSHDLDRLAESKFWRYPEPIANLLGEGLFGEKVKRIMLYTILKELNIDINSPDLSGEWLELAGKKANAKVKEKFGIKRELSLNESLALIRAKVDGNEREKIQELADSKIEKSFQMAKQYQKLDVPKLKEKGDPVKITEYLVAGFTSTKKRPDHFIRLKNALTFFQKEKLRNARDFVLRSDPRKIFREVENDVLLMKQGDAEAASRIRSFFKDLAKKGKTKDKWPEDAEALSDLIDAVESIGKARVFDSILIKMQSGDMTDLIDNTTTSCCAFYPDGANSEASIYYLKDPEIGLLWIKSATLEGEELDNIGVTIMSNCKDGHGRKVLLVDSVEGGEALERSGVEWKEKMLESIKQVAKENGAEYIMLNSRTNNATPQKFNSFVSETAKKDKIYLEKIEGTKAIVEWSDKGHYLEAFGGWKSPTGTVEGYVVKVE